MLKIECCRCPLRFHSFLLFIGHPAYSIREISVHRFSKILSEFALEYRTTRDRVLQQKQKRADHRERNKTRGKMIVDVKAPVSLARTDTHFLLRFFLFSLQVKCCFVTFFPSFSLSWSLTFPLSIHCSLMMKRRVRYRHVCWLSACVCLTLCMKPLTECTTSPFALSLFTDFIIWEGLSIK